MWTLSIDTGAHVAAALHCEGMLQDVFAQYKKGTAHESKEVKALARDITEWVEQYVPVEDVHVVVEAPSHRYFGRGNASAVLKTMWQVIRLASFFNGRSRSISMLPAPIWNKRRNDKQKRKVFMRKYPSHKEIPYYVDKHGSRSNDHERDAVLLGRWFYLNVVSKTDRSRISEVTESA